MRKKHDKLRKIKNDFEKQGILWKFYNESEKITNYFYIIKNQYLCYLIKSISDKLRVYYTLELYNFTLET